MAAKKSAKKTATKKTTTKKATTKKAAAKKTASKKTATQKTAPKKATAKKAATRKAAKRAKETVADPSEETVVATPEPPVEEKPKSKPKDGVSSTSVNIGHAFSLRPRVNTSYRQADFAIAKQLLQDETYANIQDAARAIVAKALELTHKGSPLGRSKPKRR